MQKDLKNIQQLLEESVELLLNPKCKKLVVISNIEQILLILDKIFSSNKSEANLS